MAARKTSAVKAVTKAVARAAKRPAGEATASASTARKRSATTTKSASKTSGVTKTPAKTSATKPATSKKSATTKKATTAKAATEAAPAKAAKAATKTATPAKPEKKAATTKRGARATAPKLAVREGEKPWTAREIAEVRALLEHDKERLEAEIAAFEEEIGHLLREGGEGAGHDQADVGSTTFERDHEMSIAQNARDNLTMVEQAMGRIDDGSYGICESCGRPIGKMRLQAFPRATLCMECKQRQERR